MNRVVKVFCLLTLTAFLAAPMVTTAGMKLPAADGKALWAYLTGVKYQETFALWPGKGKLYKGKEPPSLQRPSN